MEQLIVNSDKSLDIALKQLRTTYGRDKYVRVKMYSGQRTLPQDSLAHIWYSVIANDERWQNSPEWVKSEMKLNYGLPILAKDPEHEEYISNMRIALRPMSYEQKIHYMKYVPVTRLMTTGQESEYMDQIQRIYAAEGLILESNKRKRDAK